MRLATLSLPALFVASSIYLGQQCEGQNSYMLHSSVRAADSQLIVRSPVTGAQLDKLTVRVMRVESAASAPGHPGLGNATEVIMRDAASPLNLSTGGERTKQGQRVYYVGSPGYAWKALHFDPTQAGRHEIQLVEGGELTISFEDAPKDARLRLRLREKGKVGGALAFESKAGRDGSVQIAGLIPAVYLARIELDGIGASPKTLAEAMVVVRGGRSSEYRLHSVLPRAK